MRLREIFRYEVGHLVRSASTWAYAGILFLVAIWMFLATADGDGLANAPERLAGISVGPGLFGMLVTAALFGGAAVRDLRAEMDALVYTTPVRKAEYLGGRFLGALAINAILLVAIPLGLMAATGLLARFDPEPLAPFRLLAYAQPYFLFLLPNLVVVAVILFAIGVLARHMVPVYLAAIGVLIAYVVALNYADRIANPVLVWLIDPLGLVTMQSVTRYWTEAERSTQLIGLPAALAWNRALWLGIAAVVFALLQRVFRFEHVLTGGRLRAERRLVSAPRAERTRAVEVPRVALTFGARTAFRQTLAIAYHALREVMTSRWFVVVILACVGLPLLWGWNVGTTVFDTSTWPVTLLVTETVLAQRSVLLFYVLIILFAGELVWRERESGIAEIADAAPVSFACALAGRFLALAALILMFQAAAMAGGLLIQVLQGYFHFEIGLYLRVVFGLKLADYLILAALALTIHVAVNHKNLAHMLVLLAIGFPFAAGPLLGIRHHLLLFNTDSGWTYSDMNGFGPFVGPVVWFKLYWAAWALLLLIAAILLQVRGLETGLRQRLRQARARMTGTVARTAGFASALIVGLGGFIFYNTNVLNEYVIADEIGTAQAEYERRYARYEGMPQPSIVSAALRIEIHPERGQVELRGAFGLVNRTASTIDSVHLTLNRDLDVHALSVDRAAEPVHVDADIGYRIYALERALAPGDSVRLTFDVAFRPRGFSNDGPPTDVVGNGTNFDRRWMPLIGYQPFLEVADERARRRLGLAPRAPMPDADDLEARRYRHVMRDADLVHVDAIIGTAADQIAITPSVLRRSWTENGRNYFHYRTETPTAFGATVFSARYAVLEDRWNDVSLSVFHHPGHTANLDRTVRSMKASLAYLGDQFGAYPDRQLRVVEIPRYGGFGRAHPHTIAFTEDYFFSRVREGEVDQPFYGTAHEVAHQWWGGRVRGGLVRGHAFLSESLANYSAMMIVEKTFGLDAARRVYDFQMERYLRGRALRSGEVALLDVEDQPYIAYRKGAIAMYSLRERIGEDAVNGALRRYVEKYGGDAPPYPTSRDLYAELLAAAPDSLHPLLEDLFETVTVWEVETERAVVEPTGDGAYRVTLDIVARKLRADSIGRETEVPLDDVVEIGVFGADAGDRRGELLYRGLHRIRSGAQSITVIVTGEPARAGIDPWRRLIDRRRDDNVVDVETVPGGSGGTAP